MRTESREKILARLESTGTAAKNAAMPGIESRLLFADYPQAAAESLRETFIENFRRLRGEACFAPDLRTAAQQLMDILHGISGAVAWEEDELISLLMQEHRQLAERLGAAAAVPASSVEFARFAASITSADMLSARTGSVLLRSSRSGGRRFTVLPPVHIVLARQSQLAETIAPWLSLIKDDGSWSTATVISGPSRTADIEKILVLGAHGPKRLVLILLGD